MNLFLRMVFFRRFSVPNATPQNIPWWNPAKIAVHTFIKLKSIPFISIHWYYFQLDRNIFPNQRKESNVKGKHFPSTPCEGQLEEPVR